MAEIIPIYMRKAVILVKIETDPGTDAAPTGAANAMLVRDFTLTPLEGDALEYEQIQAHFGAFDGEMATTYSKLECSVYLAGSGTAGTKPQFDPLMQICGAGLTLVVDESSTYAPVTSGIKAATIYVNIDGINHVLRYARGDVTGTVDAKGYPMLKFSLQGLFTPVADAGLPVPTFAATARAVPVNKANSTLNLHSTALRTSKFGFAFGNQVVYRNLMGFEGVTITGRKSSYSATFEAVPIATKNWPAIAVAGATGALSWVHGTVPGNIVTFTSAKANLKPPSISEEDGIKMENVTGALIPSAAGNDEWSIAFT